MSLTARQLYVLRGMVAAEIAEDFDNCEIVSEGIACYIGDKRISWKTLNAFIDHVLVSSDQLSDGSFRRWNLNEIGRLISGRPEMADETWLRLRSGKPFTIKGDEIVDLK